MKNIKGIIPPMITPLKELNSLDDEGLERLVEHIIGGGVHGLFILGTTGEGPSISYKLRRKLIERTCLYVDRRVPVLVAISDTAFAESISLANFAADHGADAVVLAPPYYFPADQPELIEYIQHMVNQLPLPLFLYNMPSHTKIFFEIETIKQLVDIDGIAGIKDSSGNMVYFYQLLEMLHDRDDFSVLIGPEELLAESLLFGGDGGVNGGANVFPELYVKMYNAGIARDIAEITRLHNEIFRFRKIYQFGRHWSSLIKGQKCALKCMGICNDFMAEPFHRFHETERQKIKQHLLQLGLVKS